MSSSNIIKPNSAHGQVFEKFSFETIRHEMDAIRPAGQQPDFVPFLETIRLDSTPVAKRSVPTESCDTDAGQGLVVIEPEVPAGIPEEVHFQQVQESYEKGFEEGKRQAERGLGNVFKALRDAVEDLAGMREHILRESEGDLLKLAALIARKVIHQEIATDRVILANVVSAAVSSASERDEIVIRLNPEDHRLVSAHKHLYLSGCGDERLVELKSDDTIAPGGCVVDTVMGEIDARTDAQVDEIFRRLLEEKTSFVSLAANLVGEREQHAYDEN